MDDAVAIDTTHFEARDPSLTTKEKPNLNQKNVDANLKTCMNND